MSIDLEAFPRQLRYWSGHCLLNALPSFIIAALYMQYWQNPDALLAMGAAVLVFILLYSLLTSIRGPLTQSDHVLNRAMRAGTKFRMIVSIASLPFLVPGLVFCAPDFWCGLLAVGIVQRLAKMFGDPSISTAVMDRMGNAAGFKEVFATTMIEGMLISLLLFMFSFFAVLFIQRKERVKVFAAGSVR